MLYARRACTVPISRCAWPLPHHRLGRTGPARRLAFSMAGAIRTVPCTYLRLIMQTSLCAQPHGGQLCTAAVRCLPQQLHHVEEARPLHTTPTTSAHHTTPHHTTPRRAAAHATHLARQRTASLGSLDGAQRCLRTSLHHLRRRGVEAPETFLEHRVAG